MLESQTPPDNKARIRLINDQTLIDELRRRLESETWDYVNTKISNSTEDNYNNNFIETFTILPISIALLPDQLGQKE